MATKSKTASTNSKGRASAKPQGATGTSRRSSPTKASPKGASRVRDPYRWEVNVDAAVFAIIAERLEQGANIPGLVARTLVKLYTMVRLAQLKDSGIPDPESLPAPPPSGVSTQVVLDNRQRPLVETLLRAREGFVDYVTAAILTIEHFRAANEILPAMLPGLAPAEGE